MITNSDGLSRYVLTPSFLLRSVVAAVLCSTVGFFSCSGAEFAVRPRVEQAGAVVHQVRERSGTELHLLHGSTCTTMAVHDVQLDRASME